MNRTIAVFATGLLYAFAPACDAFSAKGQPVTFGDQSNIIVWNPDTKTEHFIRNAFFNTKAQDFGFIAATPTVPELKESSAKAYGYLASFKPHETSFGCGAQAEANSADAVAAGSIDILQEVNVGKYQATTVRSDDASAMASYLKSNGYSITDGSKEWISFYTNKKWVFTAFKVRQGKEGRSETGVIRMSFKTDEPFNPYYVPAERSSDTGTMRLYFVSDGTYGATVGHGAKWIPATWNNQIGDGSLNGLAVDTGISESEFPKNLTVTYFEKRGWLDGSKDDLYFKKDSPFGPLAIIGIAALGGGLWWFTRSRRAKAIGAYQ